MKKPTQEMIIRHFKVDRTKGKKEMITALGRNESVYDFVLATMPTEGPDEGDLYFFLNDQLSSFTELTHKLESLDLILDVYAQIQVNIDDPSFADKHLNIAPWSYKEKGNFCFVAFGLYDDGRGVDIGLSGGDSLNPGIWLAGRRN